MTLLREDLQIQSGRGQGRIPRGGDFQDDIWTMSGDLPGRPWRVAFQAEGQQGSDGDAILRAVAEGQGSRGNIGRR